MQAKMSKVILPRRKDGLVDVYVQTKTPYKEKKRVNMGWFQNSVDARLYDGDRLDTPRVGR